MKSKIKRFLNVNFKPIMSWYYRRFHKHDIMKVLIFINTYCEKGVSVPIDIVVMVMCLDNGWSKEKSINVFGMCIYCGFISNENNG